MSSTSSPQATPAGERPFVSVIIPTYNRGTMLVDAVRALFRQDYPRDRMEIIVVDNSSSDDTPALMAQLEPESPFPFAYHIKENRGPAASRNYGLARCRGAVVGFTDSDCSMDPTWVTSAVQAMRPGIGVLTGPIVPVYNPERPPGYFHHQLPGTFKEDFMFQTANIFFLKQALDEVGGFDERFGVYSWGSLVGGEDTDVGWRVLRASYQSAFDERVRVYHEASSIPFKKWLGEPLRAQIYPLLVALHPKMRQVVLWNRVFLNRFTAAFYFGALGVAIGILTDLRIAVLAPLLELYLLRHAADLRSPSQIWKAPLRLSVAYGKLAIAIVALWYGSLRFRTLVI